MIRACRQGDADRLSSLYEKINRYIVKGYKGSKGTDAALAQVVFEQYADHLIELVQGVDVPVAVKDGAYEMLQAVRASASKASRARIDDRLGACPDPGSKDRTGATYSAR